ncbi:hypothetical protein HK096_009058, partial [Nowakowskiella sp. JEL0078]
MTNSLDVFKVTQSKFLMNRGISQLRIQNRNSENQLTFSDDQTLSPEAITPLDPISDQIHHPHRKITAVLRTQSWQAQRADSSSVLKLFSDSKSQSTTSLAAVGVIRPHTLAKRSSLYGGALVVVQTHTSELRVHQGTSKLRWVVLL